MWYPQNREAQGRGGLLITSLEPQSMFWNTKTRATNTKHCALNSCVLFTENAAPSTYEKVM